MKHLEPPLLALYRHLADMVALGDPLATHHNVEASGHRDLGSMSAMPLQQEWPDPIAAVEEDAGHHRIARGAVL